MKNKFLVISYDDDQQQTFFDIKEAANREAAMSLVDGEREDAIPIEALAVLDVENLLKQLKA